MADRRSKKQDKLNRVKTPKRLIRLSAAAGTFLTISLSPLASMPVARADGEDVIIDQIINSLSAVDPTAALDMSSWLSSLDAALQGAANFDPSSLDGVLDPSTWASALDPSLFDPRVWPAPLTRRASSTRQVWPARWTRRAWLRPVECGRRR